MEYLTNYEEKPKNIICGELQKISIIYSKLNIYNPDCQHPLQKYWFHLKNIKIVKQTGSQIEIALSNTKFINYLGELEDNVHTMMCKLFKYNFEKYSSYQHKEYSPIILSLSCTGCSIFDENNNIINYNFTHIKYDNHVTLSILIELSDIIIGENDYWINYSIKQLKFNPSFNITSKSIFELIENKNPENKKEKSLVIPPPPDLNIPDKLDTPEIKVEKPEPFVISVDDIQNQIIKMRNKKKLREEEQMESQIGKMMTEIQQFRHKSKLKSNMVKQINLEN